MGKVMENRIEMDDLGVTTIFGNIHREVSSVFTKGNHPLQVFQLFFVHRAFGI